MSHDNQVKRAKLNRNMPSVFRFLISGSAMPPIVDTTDGKRWRRITIGDVTQRRPAPRSGTAGGA